MSLTLSTSRVAIPPVTICSMSMQRHARGQVIHEECMGFAWESHGRSAVCSPPPWPQNSHTAPPPSCQHPCLSQLQCYIKVAAHLSSSSPPVTSSVTRYTLRGVM